MRLGAAVCVALAVLMIRPPSSWLVRWRLDATRWRGGSAASIRWARRAAVLGLVVSVIRFGGALPHLIVGLTAIGVVAVCLRVRRRNRDARRRREHARQVAEIVDALAAELGSGVLATQAIRHLALDSPLLAKADSASRLGGDVAGALRVSARVPGAESLGDLAAAWEVSERSGAPMARVLDRLGDSLRDERDVQREIDAGLGPAKATARLMAVLPVIGLAMGANMGSNPLHVLVGTLIGSICLAMGAALACVGVCWVDAIAARAEKV